MVAREGRPRSDSRGGPGDLEERLDVQARLLAADEDAYRAVYERYALLVLSAAVRLVRDRAAAEDIMQEVFAHLWERPLAYDPARGSLRAWLLVVAHHRSVDWIRREEKRRALHSPHEPPRGDETAEAVEDSMTSLRVRAIAGELPETLRRPLLLAYYGGRTYREVADELGIPEGTAKARLRAALHHMATALATEGITP